MFGMGLKNQVYGQKIVKSTRALRENPLQGRAMDQWPLKSGIIQWKNEGGLDFSWIKLMPIISTSYEAKYVQLQES